jgi:nucleoside-diphosphate-sugar epimerase
MIVLTGASGFLGKEIIKTLLLNEKDFITIGRNSNKDNVVCDLSFEIPKICYKNAKVVIHTAGMAHRLPKNNSEIKKMFQINVDGTRNLLTGLSNSILPQQFVFISSVSVYGVSKGVLIDENAILAAKDAYGQSKIKAEMLIIKWCEEHNVKYTILRLPLLVGDKPPGNLGAMISGIRKGLYFNISGGKAKKSMVLASDVALNILKAAEVGGIFNLTDGYHPNFYELSSHISSQLGKKKPKNLSFLAARSIALIGDLFGSKIPLNSVKFSKIISELTFSDIKAQNEFGWKPTPVLKGFKIKK